MKAALLRRVLISLVYIYAWAQNDTIVIDTMGIRIVTNEPTLEEYLEIFSALDTTAITTGVLFDRATLYSFGWPNGEGDTLDYFSWRTFYRELRIATIANPLPELETYIDKVLVPSYAKNQIPIGVLHYRYQFIRLDAVNKGWLLYQGGKLYDVSPPDSSIYGEAVLFAVAPLKAVAPVGGCVLVVDSTTFFTNVVDSGQIVMLEIRSASDSMWVPIMQQNYYCAFNTPGTYYFHVRAITMQGDTLYNVFHIKVKDLDGVAAKSSGCIPPFADIQVTIEASIPYSGWSYTGNPNDINGAKGKADVYVWLAPGHTQITRPFILLDGFDPFLPDGTQSRNNYDLYCLLNQQEDTVSTVSLLQNVYCFDIITVNWHGGADWIQKNAFALVEILQWINANKVGKYKNVVVGPSMGGIIARYALSYMEQNNIPHDVGILICWDSPHRGANVPLGLQYYMDFWADYFPLADIREIFKKVVEMLDSPASRQLLIEYYKAYTFCYIFRIIKRSLLKRDTIWRCTHFSGTDSMRIQLVNELNALGNYPQQPYLIAVANGSGIGQPQRNSQCDVFSTNEPIVELLIYADILVGTVKVLYGIAKGLPDPSVPPGEYTIFEGEVLKKNIPSFLCSLLSSLAHTYLPCNVAREVKVQSDKPQLDRSPGGWFPEFCEMMTEPFGISGCILSISNTSGIFQIYQTLHNDRWNHEPTLSTLDVDHSITDFFYSNITTQQTPFDTIFYTTQPDPTAVGYPCSWNEQHSDLTQQKRDFLLTFVPYILKDDIYIQNEVLYMPPTSEVVEIQAKNAIFIGRNVTSSLPQGDVIVESGQKIIFRAGNKIVGKPGLHIKPGASARAVIQAPNLTCPPPGDVDRINPYSGVTVAKGGGVTMASKTPSFPMKEPIVKEPSIKVYPNPTRGVLHVVLPDDAPAEIVVLDLLGRPIAKWQVTQQQAILELPDRITKGIYFLIIKQDQHLWHRKFFRY